MLSGKSTQALTSCYFDEVTALAPEQPRPRRAAAPRRVISCTGHAGSRLPAALLQRPGLAGGCAGGAWTDLDGCADVQGDGAVQLACCRSMVQHRCRLPDDPRLLRRAGRPGCTAGHGADSPRTSAAATSCNGHATRAPHYCWLRRVCSANTPTTARRSGATAEPACRRVVRSSAACRHRHPTTTIGESRMSRWRAPSPSSTAIITRDGSNTLEGAEFDHLWHVLRLEVVKAISRGSRRRRPLGGRIHLSQEAAGRDRSACAYRHSTKRIPSPAWPKAHPLIAGWCSSAHGSNWRTSILARSCNIASALDETDAKLGWISIDSADGTRQLKKRVDDEFAAGCRRWPGAVCGGCGGLRLGRLEQAVRPAQCPAYNTCRSRR